MSTNLDDLDLSPVQEPRTRTKTTTTTIPLADLEAQITEGYEFLGLLISMVRPTVGGVWLENSERMAKSWIVAARANPKFRKRLESGLIGGVWAAILFAHVPVAVAAAKDFGFISPAVSAQIDAVEEMLNTDANTGG